jgi:hypothetical protein
MEEPAAIHGVEVLVRADALTPRSSWSAWPAQEPLRAELQGDYYRLAVPPIETHRILVMGE